MHPESQSQSITVLWLNLQPGLAKWLQEAPRSSQVKESNHLFGQQHPAVCLSLYVLSGNNIIRVLAGHRFRKLAADNVTL